jgi:2-polyprenyl-3-methyl-5-hydroxy-6-metoxy-1,4-benzoquinol methylase
MSSNVWETIHAKQSWGHYPNEELVRFIGRNFRMPKEKKRDIKILEIGCGQGANLWFLAKEGFDVYGVDGSPSAIKKAKVYLKQSWGINSLNLEIQDIRELNFNILFDVIIDVATTQHVSYLDHKKVYGKIYDLLKPKGFFWSFHIAEDSWGSGCGNLTEYKTYDNIKCGGPLNNVGTVFLPSEGDMKNLLQEARFKIVSLEKLLRTYENQTKNVIHWITEAQKD